MNSTNTQHDDNQTLDDLDETLDDLADLPETKPFPAGAHIVALKIRRNPKKAGQYVVEMLHEEVVELANPTDEESTPKPGDKSTVFIATKKKDGTANEIGQGQLKIVMKPIGAMLGTNSIGEILEGAKAGVRCAVVLSIKSDKTGQYDDANNITSVEVV